MAIQFKLKYTPPQVKIFFDTKDYKYLVIPKGRRFGMTKGAANAFIEYMMEGNTPLLWVDTINGNIDRYFDRYFLPELKKLPSDKWSFNRQKRELKIYNSICDLRSADSPESIEGFGYKVIFLNEAGIILKDSYLYSNSILPMLLDFPDSRLIAAGVPKGKTLKSGGKHKFFDLYERAVNKEDGYKLLRFTSYDNPMLRKEDIDALAGSMSDIEYQQEIMGEFVEYSGNNPFAHQYKPEKHESVKAVFDPNKQLKISIDFNLNPFAVTFSNIWFDNDGHHCHVFDEASIENGSIQKMIDLIKSRYLNQLPNCQITGDAMGKRRQQGLPDLASFYDQLQRGLGLRASQIVTPGNPTHENSRADVNYILYHFDDLKINPKTCPKTCRDMRVVQCDAFGQIVKRNRNDVAQQSDQLDTIRYLINTFLWEWKESHQKGKFKLLPNKEIIQTIK